MAAGAAKLEVSHARSNRRSRRRGGRRHRLRPLRNAAGGGAVRRRRRRVAQLRRGPRQHEVLAARPDRRRQLRRSAHRVALGVGGRRRRSRGDRLGRRAVVDLRPAGDAADDRRGAVPVDRALPGGRGRCRHGGDDLGARPAGLPGREADTRLPLARRRLLERGRRQRRANLLGDQRGVPPGRRCAHRRTDPRLRRRRPRRSDGGHPARGARRDELPGPQPHRRRIAARHRARRRPHADHRVGLRDPPRGAAGLGEGRRRADGRRQVGVPDRAPGRRFRRRHVAERVVALLRQRQHLAAAELRRGARHVLPADRHADQRLLRRPPPGRQPLRREHRGRRRRDRRARLALPGRAPRGLGLRLPGRPDAPRHHRRRPAHQGARAGEQAGLHLRLRSGDGRAGLADRGARGGDRHRPAGRGAVAHAAVPDEAAALRVPGHQHRRPGRLHARDPADGDRGGGGLPARPALHAAHADRGGRPAGGPSSGRTSRGARAGAAPRRTRRRGCSTCRRRTASRS